MGGSGCLEGHGRAEAYGMGRELVGTSTFTLDRTRTV
jgi:hypothetical protein